MRKTLLLCATLGFLPYTMQAQIQKDNILVGGSIGNIQATFQSGASSVSLNINPKAGYFLRDNFALGAGINIGLTGSKGVTTIDYGILPFARYYFSPNDMKKASVDMPVNHLRFFGEVDFGISGFNTLTDGNSTSTNGLSFSVGPGAAYFLTPNVGLETLLKLRGITGFGNSTVAFQPELSVGFQIYLSSKKAKQRYNEEKKNMRTTD